MPVRRSISETELRRAAPVSYSYDNIVDGDTHADSEMLRDNRALAPYPS